jgi:prophage antirepressor-like protein
VSIIPYTFPETGTPVRTVTIGGEPWFVVADICRVLGIGNPSDAVRRLNEGDLDTIEVTDSLGRTQKAYAANESGLYDLILDSRKPEARAFRRWITSDVIPSIRRTGSYAAPAAPVQVLPDMATPEGRRAVAAALLAAADREIELNERVAELEPKALAHDTLMAAQAGDVLIRQAAKLLGWRERDLRTFLVDEHLIYRRQAVCGAAMWDFYAANSSHFNATETVVTHTWGDCAHYTLHVTPRGMELVQARIAKRQAEMAAAIGGAA